MNPRFKFRIWGNYQHPPRFMNPATMPVYFDTWQDFLNKFTDKAWTFQQSTGLFDKNNKEIFEGDILKYELHKFPGKFNIFAVEWDKYGQAGGFPRLLLFHSTNAEVIGNIFENPDLLKHEGN